MVSYIGGAKIPTLTYPKLTRISSVYIDQNFLDSYMEVLSLDSTWVAGADSIAKDAAIIRSQIYIESLNYQGYKRYGDQILLWPRYPVYDKDGYLIDSDETPYDIFNAVAEGSYHEYTTPGILQPKETVDDVYPLKRKKAVAGSVESEKEFETTGARHAVPSAELIERLNGYLAQWQVKTGGFVPLIRT